MADNSDIRSNLGDLKQGVSGKSLTQISKSDARLLMLGLAILVTATSLAMAVAAALERGGTFLERSLLVALSVSICLSVHLLPSISRSKLAWAMWVGCFLCALYSHTYFLTSSSRHAGEVRAQGSAQMAAVKMQIDSVSSALSQIKSRPVTEVSLDIANTYQPRMRRALKAELSESQRASFLRDELVRLNGLFTAAQQTDSVDPVAALLITVTGGNESTINFAIWVTFSVLLELLGALLWVEVIRRTTDSTKVEIGLQSVKDLTTDLKDAIDTGACKPTVVGIRTYLRCSQQQAMHLRRALAS